MEGCEVDAADGGIGESSSDGLKKVDWGLITPFAV